MPTLWIIKKFICLALYIFSFRCGVQLYILRVLSYSYSLTVSYATEMSTVSSATEVSTMSPATEMCTVSSATEISIDSLLLLRCLLTVFYF